MATSLPTLRKTWQYTVNTTVTGGVATTLHRAMMYRLKQGMISVSLSPWTVVGSSDGVAFGIDGVDRWTGETSPIPDSWIVLKQTALASNFQICWQTTEFAGIQTRNNIWVSPATGFSGGGATTRPTAADEILITVTGLDGGVDTADVYVNVAVSTDGKATRCWAIQSGVPITWVILDHISNPISELTTPWLAYSTNLASGGGDPGAPSYNNFDNTGPLVGFQGATQLTYALAAAGLATTSDRVGEMAGLNAGVNQLSGDYPLSPAAVACTTASNRGVHGDVVDLWLGSTTALTGDTYPEVTYSGSGGIDQFVHVGDVILPWNNTVPLTGGGARTRRQGRVIHFVQSLSPPGTETMATIHTAGFGGSTGAQLATVSPIYTSGAVWFVSSTVGVDAAAPAGKSREAPLATLSQAQTNASAGDVIVMLTSHAEVLGAKLTLSKAGLVLLGEGAGTSRPTFSRSADVNMWDITGAGIRVENILFATDGTAGFTSDRVLVSANGTLFRGCYFASGSTSTASPALAIANAVTNTTIDGATYFVSSGTSRTVTGYRGLELKGTTTDLDLNDVTFDAGTWGWLSHAWNGTGAVTRLRAINVDLLSGSDVVLASSTTGYIYVRAESGASRIEWP